MLSLRKIRQIFDVRTKDAHLLEIDRNIEVVARTLDRLNTHFKNMIGEIEKDIEEIRGSIRTMPSQAVDMTDIETRIQKACECREEAKQNCRDKLDKLK